MELQLPDLPPDAIVAVDTETSGLFVDDGARVSVVSIAWYPGGRTPGTSDFWYDHRNQMPLPETAVYAFDQGLDTPLGPKDVSHIPAKRRPQASLFDDNIEAAPNLPPADYYRLMDWLADKSLVFFNAKFDLHILAAGLRGHEAHRGQIPDLSRQVLWDAQVVNAVIWPEFPTALKPTAGRLWGEDEGEPQRRLNGWLKKNDMRFDLAPWSLLGPYAAQDASQTIRLFDIQQLSIDLGERGDPNQTRIVCEREVDLAIVLYRMERRGIGLDADAMLDEAEHLVKLSEQVQGDLRQEISDKFPHRYPQPRNVPAITEHLMRRLWFDKPEDGGLGLFPVKMTQKEVASVDQEVVRTLAERHTPFATLYQHLNALETAVSMWFGTWPRQSGPPAPDWHPHLVPRNGCNDPIVDARYPRLRTNYRQSRTHQERGGTISGRLAVERVQLQAIPHDYQMPEGIRRPVRSFLTPDPGFELWEVDLAQAEYRVAAGISKCQKMIDRFLAGDDAHAATARLIWQIDEEHPDWNQRRNVAKRLNFGMLYGAGADTTRRQIEIYTGIVVPTEELEKWLKNYRMTFPELGRKSRQTQRQVEKFRCLRLAGGRERYFAPYESEHKAFNQLIQGGVAEMMKESMIQIEAEIPDVLLLQIHDSTILELPEGGAEPIVERVKRIMVDIFEAEFQAPFRADAKRWKQ